MKQGYRPRWRALVLFGTALVGPAQAQDQPPKVTVDWGKVVGVSSPEMAPDGKSVVIVVSRVNYAENRSEPQLVMVEPPKLDEFPAEAIQTSKARAQVQCISSAILSDYFKYRRAAYCSHYRWLRADATGVFKRSVWRSRCQLMGSAMSPGRTFPTIFHPLPPSDTCVVWAAFTSIGVSCVLGIKPLLALLAQEHDLVPGSHLGQIGLAE
jgi:hypothetical protein